MNILFITENTAVGSHVEDICSGIKKHTDTFILIDYTFEYLAMGKKNFEQHVIDACQASSIDLIFLAIGFNRIIDPLFLYSINRNIKVITMFSDSEHLFEINDRYYAQCADLVWILGPAMISCYKNYALNAVWTQGFDTKRYYKEFRPKTKDISFVGGIDRGGRQELIAYIEKNSLDIQVYGYGSKNGKVTNAEKNEIVWSSKININFTSISQQGKEGYGRIILERIKQAKGRPMEIAMCGGFVLSEYAPGLEEMFEIGSEIDVFYTKEEMVEKIKYYLAHDNIRDAMAQKAHERALRDYESKASFQKVLNALENLKPTTKTLYIDKEFAQLFTSARIYYGFRFLSKGMVVAFIDEMKIALQYGGFCFRNIYYDALRGIFHEMDAKFRFIGGPIRSLLAIVRKKALS